MDTDRFIILKNNGAFQMVPLGGLDVLVLNNRQKRLRLKKSRGTVLLFFLVHSFMTSYEAAADSSEQEKVVKQVFQKMEGTRFLKKIDSETFVAWERLKDQIVMALIQKCFEHAHLLPPLEESMQTEFGGTLSSVHPPSRTEASTVLTTSDSGPIVAFAERGSETSISVGHASDHLDDLKERVMRSVSGRIKGNFHEFKHKA